MCSMSQQSQAGLLVVLQMTLTKSTTHEHNMVLINSMCAKHSTHFLHEGHFVAMDSMLQPCACTQGKKNKACTQAKNKVWSLTCWGTARLCQVRCIAELKPEHPHLHMAPRSLFISFSLTYCWQILNICCLLIIHRASTNQVNSGVK